MPPGLSRLLALILAVSGFLLPGRADGRTLTLTENPTVLARAVERFEPRQFPHFLQHGSISSIESDQRAGNAAIVPATKRPTILQFLPRMLSELGEDPVGELEKIAQEAEPETIRILAIRVDFLQDSPGEASTGDGRFDLRPAEEAEIPIDPPPHNKAYFESHLEALSRYYDVQSQGSLVLEYDVFPAESDSAYHLSDTERYGPWVFSVTSDTILARADRIVRDSITLADSLDAAIDWKRYQSFLVFHAGADFQGDVRRDTNYDIPSFNLFLGDSLEVYAGGPDSVMINLVMVVPETVSQDDFLGALNGVMSHEFGHQLGFFDLYDVFSGLPRVGVFSLMDSGDGQFGTIADPYNDDRAVAVRGVLPVNLDPWHKLLFFPDGVHLRQARDGEEIELDGVAMNNDILQLPIHLSEYFLVETRPIDYNGDGIVILRADPETGVVLGPEPAEENPDDDLARLEYDYLLPGDGGVLVWHIDEFAAITGLIEFGAVNVFADRLGVDVEEADGIQDIGTASSEFLGGPFDPFFVGGFTQFGAETVPDSRTNDETPTGISLEILDPPQPTMRLRVGAPVGLEGWPIAFLGATPPNGLNRVDLDVDGFEEILLAAGPALLGLTSEGLGFAEGGERVVLAVFPDTLEEGAAVADSGCGFPSGSLPVIGARAGGAAFWVDILGDLFSSWPDRPGKDVVTAGPIAAKDDSLWFVGTADGRVLGLRPAGNLEMETLVSVDPTAADTIVALAAGRVMPGAPLWVAFGTSEGEVGVDTFVGRDRLPSESLRWTHGSGPIRAILGFRAPLGLGEDPVDLLLVASEDRRLDLRDLEGNSVEGWPVALSDTLAGSPAIGDPDSDGLIEIVVTTRTGDLYRFNLRGQMEPFWPQSLWHPDQQRRIDCITGPRLWDLDMDGRVELVQLRGDGITIVLDPDGEAVEGWPRASGAPGSEGPVRIERPNGEERWVIADAISDTVTALNAVPLQPETIVRINGIGCFPGPGVDPGRGGIYPASWVPAPQEADDFFSAADLILHPNPLRGGDLRLRYILGEDARIDAEIYDVSGRRRTQTTWMGRAGASGETHLWDLSDLASGAYVIRLRIRGATETRTMLRSIAVVR